MNTISLEKRKSNIAKIATKIFLAKGYKEATLQDIAIKAGMTKAGLYYYFRTKEEILWHTIEGTAYNLLNKLKDCAESSKSENLAPEDALRKYINTYGRVLNESRDVPLLLLRERHQLSNKYRKELKRLERTYFSGIKNQLSKVPNINKNYDITVISFMIISSCHWIGYWLSRKGELNLDSVIEQSIDVLFRGIFEKETSPQ